MNHTDVAYQSMAIFIPFDHSPYNIPSEIKAFWAPKVLQLWFYRARQVPQSMPLVS